MLSEDNFRDLETLGYTVISDVLSSDECDHSIQEYKDWLSQFKDGTWPYSKNSLIQRYNIGHFDVTWQIRIKTKPVFAKLWKTKKLLTSVDAVAIGRPPENGQETFAIPEQHWIHCDQDAERVGLHAYQGGVYLEEAEQDDWTFHVVSKSHLYMDEFYRLHPKSAFKSSINKYYHVRDGDMEWFQDRGCKMVRVPVPKGGMVLWDSRLLHANARPVKGRKNSDRWRFVVMVSMTPAIWATKSDLHIKKSAYTDVRMTTHWSSQRIGVFDKVVPSYSPKGVGMLETLPPTARIMEAKQLSGVEPYNFNDGQSNGPEWTPIWNKMFDGTADIKIKPWPRFWYLTGMCLLVVLAYIINSVLIKE